MPVVRVSERGTVAIPKAIRDRHGIKPGPLVHVADCGDSILVSPAPADAISEGLGALARFGTEPSWTEALLREHRTERETEDRAVDSLRP